MAKLDQVLDRIKEHLDAEIENRTQADQAEADRATLAEDHLQDQIDNIDQDISDLSDALAAEADERVQDSVVIHESLSDLEDKDTELDNKIDNEIQSVRLFIASNCANYLEVSHDKTTGVATIQLYSEDDTLLDTKTVNLDTNNIIKSVALNDEDKTLVFTKNDDSVMSVDVSGIIDVSQRIDDEILARSTEDQKIQEDLDGEVARIDDRIDEVLDDIAALPHDKADLGLGNVDNTADLDKPVSRATDAFVKNYVKSHALIKEVVQELPIEPLEDKRDCLYVVPRPEEKVVIYRFNSYDMSGEIEYAWGTAKKTGLVEDQYTQIKVLSNHPTDPEAADYVGRTFYVLTNAGVDDDSLNLLYNDSKEPVGIKVKLYEHVVDSYDEYLYVDNKWELISSGSADGLTVDDVARVALSGSYNDLINTPRIPVKVSELENDRGFITSTVNNLSNYYDKDTVDLKLRQLPTLKIIVLEPNEDLPTEDIDPKAIYLKPITGETGNVFEEYLYIDNEWELIGTTRIDLSNYYTKAETYSQAEVDAALIAKADKLNTYTKTEVDAALNEKVDKIKVINLTEESTIADLINAIEPGASESEEWSCKDFECQINFEIEEQTPVVAPEVNPLPSTGGSTPIGGGTILTPPITPLPPVNTEELKKQYVGKISIDLLLGGVTIDFISEVSFEGAARYSANDFFVEDFAKDFFTEKPISFKLIAANSNVLKTYVWKSVNGSMQWVEDVSPETIVDTALSQVQESYYSKDQIDTTLNDYATSQDLNDATVELNTNVDSETSRAIAAETALEDAIENSGFITKAVDDLTNYYKKSETYTKEEVNQIVANFGSFEVVQELPVQDIKTNVIYLVPKTVADTGDVYDEYIYINNNWELIGSTAIDLSDYQTKIDSSHKLDADLVDDTNSTHKFATQAVISNSHTHSNKSTLDGIGTGNLIKEISTQYVRITDLDTGLYKLTFNGIKYIRYYGTTSSNTDQVGSGNAPVILHVNKYNPYKTTYWHWFYIVGTTTDDTKIYYGYTSTSAGVVHNRTLNNIPLNALATVATSGSYNDLSGKPDLSNYVYNLALAGYNNPSIVNGTLTLHKVAGSGTADDLINSRGIVRPFNSDLGIKDVKIELIHNFIKDADYVLSYGLDDTYVWNQSMGGSQDYAYAKISFTTTKANAVFEVNCFNTGSDYGNVMEISYPDTNLSQDYYRDDSSLVLATAAGDTGEMYDYPTNTKTVTVANPGEHFIIIKVVGSDTSTSNLAKFRLKYPELAYYDSVPTEDSDNLMTSGDIYTAIQNGGSGGGGVTVDAYTKQETDELLSVTEQRIEELANSNVSTASNTRSASNSSNSEPGWELNNSTLNISDLPSDISSWISNVSSTGTINFKYLTDVNAQVGPSDYINATFYLLTVPDPSNSGNVILMYDKNNQAWKGLNITSTSYGLSNIVYDYVFIDTNGNKIVYYGVNSGTLYVYYCYLSNINFTTSDPYITVNLDHRDSLYGSYTSELISLINNRALMYSIGSSSVGSSSNYVLVDSTESKLYLILGTSCYTYRAFTHGSGYLRYNSLDNCLYEINPSNQSNTIRINVSYDHGTLKVENETLPITSLIISSDYAYGPETWTFAQEFNFNPTTFDVYKYDSTTSQLALVTSDTLNVGEAPLDLAAHFNGSNLETSYFAYDSTNSTWTWKKLTFAYTSELACSVEVNDSTNSLFTQTGIPTPTSSSVQMSHWSRVLGSTSDNTYDLSLESLSIYNSSTSTTDTTLFVVKTHKTTHVSTVIGGDIYTYVSQAASAHPIINFKDAAYDKINNKIYITGHSTSDSYINIRCIDVNLLETSPSSAVTDVFLGTSTDQFISASSMHGELPVREILEYDNGKLYLYLERKYYSGTSSQPPFVRVFDLSSNPATKIECQFEYSDPNNIIPTSTGYNQPDVQFAKYIGNDKFLVAWQVTGQYMEPGDPDTHYDYRMYTAVSSFDNTATDCYKGEVKLSTLPLNMGSSSDAYPYLVESVKDTSGNLSLVLIPDSAYRTFSGTFTIWSVDLTTELITLAESNPNFRAILAPFYGRESSMTSAVPYKVLKNNAYAYWKWQQSTGPDYSYDFSGTDRLELTTITVDLSGGDTPGELTSLESTISNLFKVADERYNGSSPSPTPTTQKYLHSIILTYRGSTGSPYSVTANIVNTSATELVTNPYMGTPSIEDFAELIKNAAAGENYYCQCLSMHYDSGMSKTSIENQKGQFVFRDSSETGSYDGIYVNRADQSWQIVYDSIATYTSGEWTIGHDWEGFDIVTAL